jgi:hypothetical protein
MRFNGVKKSTRKIGTSVCQKKHPSNPPFSAIAPQNFSFSRVTFWQSRREKNYFLGVI